MGVLIGLIGKPGSGKTTVGQMLADQYGFTYVSYGQLLKDIEPKPGATGYSIADREKANAFLLELLQTYPGLVISFNPQPGIKFWLLDQVGKYFDQTVVVHLLISDATAHERLVARDRELLQHEGARQQDRLTSFASQQLPIIQEFNAALAIKEVDVEGKSADMVLMAVLDTLPDNLAIE